MKKIRLSISFAAALLLLTTVSTGLSQVRAEDREPIHTTQATITFKDTEKHWAEASIKKAVEKGYVDGYPGGIFKPNTDISRAEFVKMVVTANNLPVELGSGKWFEAYVAEAVENKWYLPSDFNNTEIEWNKKITREEMAKIAVRAVGETTDEADKWMYLATKKGLITGLGAGKLGEKELTTRAQSVTIIERILAIKGGATLPVDKYAVSSAELVWHGTNMFTVMPEMFNDVDVNSLNGKPIEEMWNEKMMTIDSKDGLYRGQVEAVIVIDMEDKKDPNWKLVPNVKDLKWFSGDYEARYKIMDWPKSYLIVIKSKVMYNKDTDLYADINIVPVAINGFNTSDKKAFFSGKLNQLADVYENRANEWRMAIIPKIGWINTSGYIGFSIATPTSSNYRYKTQDLLNLPIKE